MSGSRVIPTSGPNSQTLYRKQVHEHWLAFGGFLYLWFTLGMSLWYTTYITSQYSTTDLWWRYFNVSGTQAFLSQIYNNRLHLLSSSNYETLEFTLLSSNVSLSSWHGNSVNMNPAYTRQILLGKIPLEAAITSLRSQAFDATIVLFSPYCWLDFNQTLQLALSNKRQARCSVNEHENAAVYFESILRNIGGPGAFISSNYYHNIMATVFYCNETITWLNNVFDQPSSSLSDEVKLWNFYGLHYWQTQLQNLYITGISETIALINALGQATPVTITKMSKIQQNFGLWTTAHAYSGFWNYLHTAASNRMVLIRNIDPDRVSASWDIETASPVVNATRLKIGPYGVIDIKLVEIPSALALYYLNFSGVLFTLLKNSHKELFIKPQAVEPTPEAWTMHNYLYYGGNPLCVSNEGLTFAQDIFGFYDGCTSQSRLSITFDSLTLLFAIASSQVSVTDIPKICRLCSSGTKGICQSLLKSTFEIHTALKASTTYSFQSSIPGAAASVVDIGFIQIVTWNDVPEILYQTLLPSNSTNMWTFYGWCTIYQWLQGTREVYSIEGDAGKYVIMTREHELISAEANRYEIPRSSSKYVGYIVIFTNVVMISVALVATCFGFSVYRMVDGYNFLQFNRVVGGVWISRPFLFVRGVTAMIILCTNTLQLTTDNEMTHFVASPRGVLENMLVAGEATWITYVLNDMLAPIAIQNTRYYAPLSTLISWCILFTWEMIAPYQAKATINRTCKFTTLAMQAECVSGYVYIGSNKRMGAMISLQLLSVVFSYAFIKTFRTNTEANTPLYLPNLSVASSSYTFFSHEMSSRGYLDCASCVMAGFVPFKKCIFDTKLWVFIKCVHAEPGGFELISADFTYKNPTEQNNIENTTKPPTTIISSIVLFLEKYIRLRSCIGLIYMILTLSGSYTYLALTNSVMGNDFWWESFNATSHQTFLINLFNHQLQMTNSIPELSIASPRYSDSSSNYASSASMMYKTTSYASTIQNEINSLQNVITALRNSDGCQAPWIFTRYCFVDFERKWSLVDQIGHRCGDQLHNGAVYLESILRNIDIDAFLDCWGDSWHIGFQHYLESTLNGVEWWKSVQSADLSEDEELLYWKQHNISEFTTQWQNFKQLGVIERLTIQNSLAYQFELTLKHTNGSFQWSTQTSSKLYWGFASDLWALASNESGIGGLSLIISSPNYAYTNKTPEVVQLINGSLQGVMGPTFSFITSLIGPFGSIDAYRVTRPNQVLSSYHNLSLTIMEILATNGSIHGEMDNIDNRGSLFIKPKEWAGDELIFYSSTILCDKIITDTTIQPFYSSGGSCSVNGMEQISFSTLSLLKAILAANLVHINMTSSRIFSICSHESLAPKACSLMLNQSIALLEAHFSIGQALAIGQEFLPYKHIIRDQIGLQMIQTVANTTSGDIYLSTINFFDSLDSDFELFAWLYVFAWFEGYREVITIRGLQGNLTTISADIPQTTAPANGLEIPISFASYVRQAIKYMTGVLLLVSILVCCAIISTKGYVEGLNMFEINRVGGIVWVGRPFLSLRGISAIILLSTAKLDLVRVESVFYFTARSSNWFTVLLACGEMGWLVYVLNDLLSVITQQYTMGYSVKSGLLIWFVSGIWSLLSPIEHSAVLNRDCYLEMVDYQAVCASGTIYIGNFQRSCTLIGFTIGTVVFCYLIERIQSPHTPVNTKHSLFLSSPGRYMFEKKYWEVDNIYYLDKASAVISGILPLQLRKQLYIFDIKMWRFHTIDLSQYPVPHETPLMHAIPLVQPFDSNIS